MLWIEEHYLEWTKVSILELPYENPDTGSMACWLTSTIDRIPTDRAHNM